MPVRGLTRVRIKEFGLAAFRNIDKLLSASD